MNFPTLTQRLSQHLSRERKCHLIFYVIFIYFLNDVDRPETVERRNCIVTAVSFLMLLSSVCCECVPTHCECTQTDELFSVKDDEHPMQAWRWTQRTRNQCNSRN